MAPLAEHCREQGAIAQIALASISATEVGIVMHRSPAVGLDFLTVATDPPMSEHPGRWLQ